MPATAVKDEKISKWRHAKAIIETNGSSCIKSQAKLLAYPYRKLNNRRRKSHGRAS